MKSIGQKLIEAMADKGLDRGELAEAVSALGKQTKWIGEPVTVSKSTVNNWVAELDPGQPDTRPVPSLRVALLVARVLDISIEYLADDNRDEWAGSPEAKRETPQGAALTKDQIWLLATAEEMGMKLAKGRLLAKPGTFAPVTSGEPDD